MAVLYYPKTPGVSLAPEKALTVSPFKIVLEAGDEKHWCACGYAKSQVNRTDWLEMRGYILC